MGSTLATCMNSKSAGCPSAAMAQFNTMVSTAKDPLCTSTGTCANHTLCTGGSLGSGTASSARSVSISWLLIALVAFSVFFHGNACDTQGMSQCNTEYLTYRRRTGTRHAFYRQRATGIQVCDVVSTLASCMNSKSVGCPSAAMAQFNTMVSNAKDPLCTATGTCANHTLCTGADSTSSDSTSFAWAAPVSLLTMACVYLGMMW